MHHHFHEIHFTLKELRSGSPSLNMFNFNRLRVEYKIKIKSFLELLEKICWQVVEKQLHTKKQKKKSSMHVKLHVHGGRFRNGRRRHDCRGRHPRRALLRRCQELTTGSVHPHALPPQQAHAKRTPPSLQCPFHLHALDVEPRADCLPLPQFSSLSSSFP